MTNDDRCVVMNGPMILGCRWTRDLSARDRKLSFRRDDTGNVVRCLGCKADVTAALSVEQWNAMLAPAVSAVPSGHPTHRTSRERANDMRNAVVRQFGGVREYLSEDRPAKALEYLKGEVVWSALDAIAAGCDDHEGLARDLAALRAEALAARDVCEDG
jgi:hypothetical protein